jgi:UDP-glucose 4-epimerase
MSKITDLEELKNQTQKEQPLKQPKYLSSLKMKKVLLTGGAGFIGSHIAVSLAESGYFPVILDNFSNSLPEVEVNISGLIGFPLAIHRIDARDVRAVEALIREESISGIIHLAAFKAVGESVKDPLKYYSNNIGSMSGILEAAQATGIQNIVFSSSCTVYGQPKEMEVTEKTPFGKAYSPYGFTKQVCERMLEDYIQAKGGKAVSLRYFNPVGAHPSGKIGELPLGTPNNLMPYLSQTAAGLRESLTIFGNDYDTLDGTCIRDYIHVVDLAEAHVLALDFLEKKENSALDIFNVGTGKGESVLEVVNTFKEVNGLDFPVRIGPRRPGDVAGIYANNQKITETLGWKPRFDIRDAARHAWLWQQTLKIKA